MHRRNFVCLAALCVPLVSQSLTVVAATNPAVHGGNPKVLVAAGAFYVVGAGPDVTTVSRWTPGAGLEVVGTAPVVNTGSIFQSAPGFVDAVEMDGWIYFGSALGHVTGGCFPTVFDGTATGGVWKCPASGAGPVQLASNGIPCVLDGGPKELAAAVGKIWFLGEPNSTTGRRLGSFDPTTGVVTDLGVVFGWKFEFIAADESGVYLLATTFDGSAAVFRFDPASSAFALVTLFPIGALGPVSLSIDGVELVVVSQCNPAGAGSQSCIGGYTYTRIAKATGAFLETTSFPIDHVWSGYQSVNGGVLDFVSSGPPGVLNGDHVSTRSATGDYATLLPAPCVLGAYPSGFVCSVLCFFRDGPLVHIATRGEGALSNYVAIGTFSASPFPATSAPVGSGCEGAGFPVLTSTAPTLGAFATLSLQGAPLTPGFLVGGNAPFAPLSVGGCAILVDLFDVSVYPIATSAAGSWAASIACPPPLLLWAGFKRRWQTALVPNGSVVLSNAVEWTFGF
jgi:hypothetical protein